MLRRQKRFDRQLEEGTLKSSTTGLPVTYTLSSPTYFAHLWEDYIQAWKAEYDEDGVTPVSKSEIRRLTFALQRSRCYWGMSPIAYLHHLQEQQANLDELNKTFSDADLNEIWVSTFYPCHLRALLTPEMKDKTENADETGGITASDIREFMMSTDKFKADESLRSKHNRARLLHSYDLGSDAEKLSDHDNGWGFRRAYDHERTIANGFSRTRKNGSAGYTSKGNGGTASSTLIPPSSESDDGKPGRSQSRRRKGGKKNEMRK
jgi:hypothetical protein